MANVRLTPIEIARLGFRAGFPVKSPKIKNPLAVAVAIALAESGGQTHPKDNVNTDGSRDRGLWQINSVAHPNISDDQCYDPIGASEAAFSIYADGHGGTFAPWSTYKSGAYLVYMPAAIPASLLAYKEWTAKPKGKRLAPGHFYPHDPVFNNPNPWDGRGDPAGPDYTGVVPGVNGFPFENIDNAIKGINPFDFLKGLYEFFFHRNGALRILFVLIGVVLLFMALRIFSNELGTPVPRIPKVV